MDIRPIMSTSSTAVSLAAEAAAQKVEQAVSDFVANTSTADTLNVLPGTPSQNQASVALFSTSRETLEKEIEAVLADPELKARLSSDYGHCMDVSMALKQHLETRGIDVSFTLTDSNQASTQVKLKDGTTQRAHKLHAFLTLELHREEGKQELIIDPSWKQFITDESQVEHLPHILVGTAEDIKRVYAPLQPLVHLEVNYDPLAGKYDAASAVELIYSIGDMSHARLKL